MLCLDSDMDDHKLRTPCFGQGLEGRRLLRCFDANVASATHVVARSSSVETLLEISTLSA